VVRGCWHVADVQAEEDRGDQSTLRHPSPHAATRWRGRSVGRLERPTLEVRGNDVDKVRREIKGGQFEWKCQSIVKIGARTAWRFSKGTPPPLSTPECAGHCPIWSHPFCVQCSDIHPSSFPLTE
jgi:hypothetical protein